MASTSVPLSPFEKAVQVVPPSAVRNAPPLSVPAYTWRRIGRIHGDRRDVQIGQALVPRRPGRTAVLALVDTVIERSDVHGRAVRRIDVHGLRPLARRRPAERLPALAAVGALADPAREADGVDGRRRNPVERDLVDRLGRRPARERPGSAAIRGAIEPGVRSGEDHAAAGGRNGDRAHVQISEAGVRDLPRRRAPGGLEDSSIARAHVHDPVVGRVRRDGLDDGASGTGVHPGGTGAQSEVRHQKSDENEEFATHAASILCETKPRSVAGTGRGVRIFDHPTHDFLEN